MHRKILQQSISFLNHESVDQRFEVDYFLIESEESDQMDTVRKCCITKTYGIEVIKKPEKIPLAEHKYNTIHESELILDFSTSVSKTKSVIEKLAKNGVTPIILRYVIDDILGE